MNEILKLWILLLAMTIFGSFTVNGLRAFVEMWSEKCRKAGVEFDSARDFRLTQEYNKCSINSLNTTQFMEDTNEMTQKFKIAKLDISTVQPTLQKYCSQAYKLFNCSENLSLECLSEEEMLRGTVNGAIHVSFVNFFCGNEASRMTEFINGKGVECGMTKEPELRLCLEQYNDDLRSAVLYAASKGDIFMLFSMLPEADILCNSLQTLGNCVKQLFQQCKLSETPADVITGLLTDMETETKCATIPKKNRESQKFEPIWAENRNLH